MKKEGVASLMPATLVEKFKESVKKYGDKPSLATKINNKWYLNLFLSNYRVSISYKAYFDDVCAFAKGLLSLELTPFKAVNIIGFNSAEWFIAFYGSIFGYYLPVGIYTTNGPDAC
jgi:long-chain-fatty-acid--CoA ligase ACSBG